MSADEYGVRFRGDAVMSLREKQILLCSIVRKEARGLSGRLSAGLLLHAAMQMHAAGSSVDACKESDRGEKLGHQRQAGRQAGSPLLAVTVSAVRT